MTWPIVYLATNRLNGKRYVGVTCKLLCQRKAQHFHGARYGKGHCKLFHAAIRKHGEDAFEWTVIFSSDSYDLALQEEVRLIAELRPEYNLTAGGEGTKGVKKSAESIEKQRASRAGWRPTEEMRQRQSAAMKGRKLSAETRQKISDGNKRRVLSAQWYANMRAAKKSGWHHTPETCAKMAATRTGRKRPEWVTAKIASTKRARRLGGQMELSL